MDDLHEWLNLFVRWFHVVAGITWIGQTYLFNWMERTFTPPEDGAKKNISGELWMVHGGGFYLVEKQKVPEIMPRTLHWFKWESGLTWISGFLLLLIVYYWGGLLIEPESDLSFWAAAGIGLGALAGGWLLYNLVWASPLGNNEAMGAAICWLLTVAIAWALGKILSPRAAVMHIGAIFGTIMAANVWLRILPAQDLMLSAVKAGQKPDMSRGEMAKRCSKHNTFMSVPVVLIMIANHFPIAIYGQQHSWAVLGALILLGWGGAKIMRDYL